MKTVSVKLYVVIGQVKTATTVLLASLIFDEKVSVRTRNSFYVCCASRMPANDC